MKKVNCVFEQEQKLHLKVSLLHIFYGIPRLKIHQMPTYLKYFPLQDVPILSMLVFSILRSCCLKSTKVDLSRKRMYFVFDAFRVSLFALNQSEILLSSELAKL